MNKTKPAYIDGKTAITGLFGNPVSHTLSPLMQNAAFLDCKINAVYLPLNVSPDDLKNAVEGIRSMGFLGVNVTLPHKSAIIPYLDEISEESKAMNSVNTVINKNGKLFGTTTDTWGIEKALQQAEINTFNKNIIILGNGGSAKAAIYAMLHSSNSASKVYIAGRSEKKLLSLKEEVAEKQGKEVHPLLLGSVELELAASESSLVINCTTVGMAPNTNETPFAKNLFHKDLAVFDIVYSPRETKLVKEAKLEGLTCAKGIDMLIYQGMRSFELWTGIEPSYDIFAEQLS